MTSMLQPFIGAESGIGYLHCNYVNLEPGAARSPAFTDYNSSPGDYLGGGVGDGIYGMGISFWMRIWDQTLDTYPTSPGIFYQHFPIFSNIYNYPGGDVIFGINFRNRLNSTGSQQRLIVHHGPDFNNRYRTMDADEGSLTGTLWGPDDDAIHEGWLFIMACVAGSSSGSKTQVWIKSYDETIDGTHSEAGNNSLYPGSYSSSRSTHSISAGAGSENLGDGVILMRKMPIDICQIRFLICTNSGNGYTMPQTGTWWSEEYWKQEMTASGLGSEEDDLNTGWSYQAAWPLSSDANDIVGIDSKNDMTVGDAEFRSGGPF
jgi:hypothetical protein